MGKSERAKGREWEQQVARDLRLIYGNENVKRRPQSAFYNDTDPDVEAPGWDAECKSGHSFSLRKAWEQANKRKRKDTRPVVFLRMIKKGGGSHSEKLAVLGYAMFLELMKELRLLKGGSNEVCREEVQEKDEGAEAV